jgi:hypothetical protein
MNLRGVALLGLAVLCYAMELLTSVDYVAGAAGAVAIPLGFTFIFSGQHRIAPALALGGGILAGIALAWVCRTAKRARMNKRASL